MIVVCSRIVIQKFLNAQTRSISAASLILACSYIASALLGFFRDRLLAGTLGAGRALDTYYAAFTVPDFIALILIFGAISAAIIPIFSSYYVKSKEEAWRYVSGVLNVFLLLLVIVCIILMLCTPWLVKLVAPGFTLQEQHTAALLMRIMFLSPILLGTSTIMSGILQFFHRFLVTALAPIMYNVGIIVGILFLYPWLGLPGLALGVVLGGVLHLCIQLPAFLQAGFSWQKIFPVHNSGIRETLKLMIPRSLGLGAGQINTIVITAIASTLTAGAISVFNLANNLSGMLVSALSVSLSTAMFPKMSLAHAQENRADFERKFSIGVSQLLFLSIPAAFLLFILRAQIVRFILGTGKFGWLDTRLTAACLGVFAVGLCFQGLIFVLSKTFYAAHNTKIPAIISIVTVMGNIILSILLVWLLGYQPWAQNAAIVLLKLQGIADIRIIGLTVAYTITAIIESALLLWFLHEKLHVFLARRLGASIVKIISASVIMCIATLIVRQGLICFNFIQLQTTLGVFLQLILSAGVGGAVYLFASHLLKSNELRLFKESFLHHELSSGASDHY